MLHKVAMVKGGSVFGFHFCNFRLSTVVRVWGCYLLVMLGLGVILQVVQSLGQGDLCIAYSIGAKIVNQCFWAEKSRSPYLISFHFYSFSLGPLVFHKLGNDLSESLQVLFTSFKQTSNLNKEILFT